MKLTAPQAISELRSKQTSTIGRHLYAVLGTYKQLGCFENDALATASDHQGQPFPTPVNLSRSLLDNIADDKLRELVRDEAKYPLAVRTSLNQALQAVLANSLQVQPLLIVKQVELLFAFSLDAAFRTNATNQSHILLLLPGEQRSNNIVLFHEADDRFHCFLPGNLIADNHLWELIDG